MGSGGGEIKKPTKGSIKQFFKKQTPADENTLEVSAQDTTSPSVYKPMSITYGIGHEKHDGEGRAITIEFEHFFLVTLYVPNSGGCPRIDPIREKNYTKGERELGQNLNRLDYRLKEWDVDLRAYVRSLEARKPVIVTGDLNVAHLDADIYNYDVGSALMILHIHSILSACIG